MKRSKWKPTHINLKRATIITPNMIDQSIKIHNGNSYRNITITSEHVGHRLGEFYNTTITPVFKTKKKIY
jgi:ribosomal protein S19